MLEIKLETSLPIYKDDPCGFTRPIQVSVYANRANGDSLLVGQFLGDILHLLQAEEVGHRLIDVFDCDVWEQVFFDLIDSHGEWREELGIDLPTFELVVFYRIVLAPCTAEVKRHILNAISEYFSCNSLIGLWGVRDVYSQGELVDLGYAKLSDSKMVLKHCGMSCNFASHPDSRNIPMIDPTEADAQWVRERLDEAQ